MLTPFIFFLAFLVRLILIPLPGFKADIAYWKWWGMAAVHSGFSGPLTDTAYNYPSFYIYILKFTSHLYEMLTGYNFKLDPQNLNFWSDTNLLYLFLIKLPYILADLGIGFLIYKIVTRCHPEQVFGSKKGFRNKFGMTVGILAASLFLFNPVVIYNSSIWGQTDSIGALLVLLSFYFLITKRYGLTAIFSAVSLFMKTQTLVLLPLLYLGIFLQTKSLSQLTKSLWIFAGTAIVINLPFLATKTMDRVFDIMYNSQLYFPYVSMNAYNIWWLFFGRASSSFWDQNLIANLISFKTAGVLLFGAIYTLAIGLVIKTYVRRVTGRVRQLADEHWQDPSYLTVSILTALTLISFAFFMLLTQMHERYIFPLFVFFPILLGVYYCSSETRTNNSVNFSPPIGGSKNKNYFLLLSIIYFLLSVTTLINLHQVMIMNYPDNTLPFLPNTFNEPLTRAISFLNLLIFLILLLLLTKSVSFKIKAFIILAFSFLILTSSFSRLLPTLNSPISLTSLRSISIKQDFGTLAINKNLSNNWQSVVFYFFHHGLSTHANSHLTYNLEGKYKTFATNFGVDTDAGDGASVVFVIIGDAKELFRTPIFYRSYIPGFAKVDVNGVKNLELVVEDAGDGINNDHADWLEPRLYR
ncbi:NPCBM/NEW2 domain-containing protein [Candidatus Gottesmanbacteria bacterium]|nr:NPCBM/NEW2 domain-containing protein [Candidatus Gottesmanbacteria bacterium]